MEKNGRDTYFYKMIKAIFIFFSLLKRMSYTVTKEIEFEVTFLCVITYFLKTECLVIANFRSLKQNQNFQKEIVLLFKDIINVMKKQLVFQFLQVSLLSWLILHVLSHRCLCMERKETWSFVQWISLPDPNFSCRVRKQPSQIPSKLQIILVC